jgi:integrase/recombinase XerD
MLSVYTRHHPDCKNAGDKTWRRCSCPKWIWGSLNGRFIRQSAKTHRWEEAEELRRQLSEGPLPADHPGAKPDPAVAAPVVRHESPIPERPQKPRVTVEMAVEAYLTDATSRGVAPATQTKLTTIFRKQFLSWTRSQGLAYLDEIDLDALLNFRSTWSDGALAKQKKQSRLIGFFWACVRRRYLQENPALGLGKIKVVQIPTDYFSPVSVRRVPTSESGSGEPKIGSCLTQLVWVRIVVFAVFDRFQRSFRSCSWH